MTMTGASLGALLMLLGVAFAAAGNATSPACSAAAGAYTDGVCRCSGDDAAGAMVDCSGLGLLRIPPGLPGNTTHLFMGANKLAALAAGALPALPRLQLLDLQVRFLFILTQSFNPKLAR